MFENLGSRYSTTSPVVVFTRDTRSDNMDAVQRSPFLSIVASYGELHGVGIFHSLNVPLLVSSIATRSALYSPNQRRSLESIIPRRGDEFGVGVLKYVIWPVTASMRPIVLCAKSVK